MTRSDRAWLPRWRLVLILVMAIAAAGLLWNPNRTAPLPDEGKNLHKPELQGSLWTGHDVAARTQELTPNAGRARLEGLVVGPDDLPIAAASVILLGETTLLTEKNGTFLVEGLSPRSYELVARKGSLVADPVSVNVTTDHTSPLVMVLHHGTEVQVKVVARDGGRPVAKARLTVEGIEALSAESDDRGVAVLDGIPSGPHAMRVSAQGFANARIVIAHNSRQSVPTRVQVTLDSGHDIGGVVIDDRQQPVNEAKVCALRADAAVLADAEFDCATTNESGQWVIAGLSSGTFRFEGTHPLYAPALSVPVRLQASGDKSVVIVLTEGATLTGRVMSGDGVGIGATVEVRNAGKGYGILGRRSIQTDSGGSFELRGLPRESVLAFAKTVDAASSAVEVDLSNGHGNVALRLTLNGRIEGEVVDATGQLISGAQIVAIPDNGAEVAVMAQSGVGRLAIGLSDDAGRFQVGPLAPGRYRLRAATEFSVQDVGFWHQQGVVAQVGDTHVKLVVLATAKIHGKVLLEGGSVPPVFSVALTLSKPQVYSTRDGVFRISQAMPGKHIVKAAAPGHEETELVVDVLKPGEDRDIGTIVLRRGQSLSGHVVDATGQPVSGARVLLGPQILGDGRGVGIAAYETQSDEAGGFTFEGLGAETLTIVAEHAAKGRSRPTTVSVNTTPLELHLSPLTSLSGIVRLQGRPVSRATVIVSLKGMSTGRLMVTTQADGQYRFDKLAEGDYLITAALQESPTQQYFQSVAAQVTHEPIVVDIEVLSGSKARLAVLEADGRACERGLAYLTTAPLRTSTLAELEAALANAGPAQTWLQVMAGAAPSSMAGVSARVMTACVVPVDADNSDPAAQQTLRERAGSLMAYCQVVDLTAVHDGDALVVKLPARP